MKKRILLLSIFLPLVFSAPFFCQDAPGSQGREFSDGGQVRQEEENAAAPDGLQIAQFNIDGLKRTRRSYMDHLLSEFLQKPASAQTLKAIETKLQAQNLFDQISVSAREIADGQAAVDISFKEKWSILPFPFGYYNGDSFAIGLFVMDMNSLGQHCATTVGGIYSPSNIMGMAAFQKPPAQVGKLGFSVMGSVSKGERQLANSKNYKVFEYENFSAGARASLLFKPTRASHASLGAGYSFFYPIDSPGMKTANQWSAGASWGISSATWNGYFLCSNSFAVGGELLFSDDSARRFSQTLNFNAQVQLPAFNRLRFMSGAKGFFSNDLFVTNYAGRSQSGTTLLPNNFATDQIVGLWTGFEAALFKGRFGILSFYALYEIAAARDWNKSIYSCAGPEAGLRFYFAKLAFPAFATGVSYNINENTVQFSFSGGASF